MIQQLKKLVGLSEKKSTTDFSDFFRNASVREKKKLFKEVVQAANKDQKKVIDEYNRLNPKTT